MMRPNESVVRVHSQRAFIHELEEVRAEVARSFVRLICRPSVVCSNLVVVVVVPSHSI